MEGKSPEIYLKVRFFGIFSKNALSSSTVGSRSVEEGKMQQDFFTVSEKRGRKNEKNCCKIKIRQSENG